MDLIYIKTTSPKGRFCRAGHTFTATGAVYDAADWSETVRTRISGEPMLHIREAKPEEIEAWRTGSNVLIPRGDALEGLKLRMDEAIQSLGHADFGKDGKPKIPALRLLLEEDGETVTAALRDEVWAEMLTAGYAIPTPA